jgi:TonB family protein
MIAKTRIDGKIPGLVVLTLLMVSTYAAAASHPCDRYAVSGLAPGMNHDAVKASMGGDGVSTVIRTQDGGETSGVTYPRAPTDVYVEYDQRIDRRKHARVVRVRVSMPLSPATIATLVRRFGSPKAGAASLESGLVDGGAAVWVDETCGLVLTAYRPTASWWAAEGGTNLQVETLDLGQRADSPANSSLKLILAPVSARSSVAPPVAPAPVALEDDLALPGEDATVVAAVPWGSQPTPAPVAPPTIAAPPAVGATATRSRTRLASPAERTHYVEPVCPPTAKWLGVKGHVTLAIVVQADGSVARTVNLVSVHPSGRGFEEASIDAVRRWRFNPAVREGRPIPSKLVVQLDIE